MIDSLMNTAIELWMEAINWSQGLWYISNSFVESISLFGTAVITDFLSIWWHFLNFSAKTLVATMIDAILVLNSRKRFIGYHVSLLNTIVKHLYALNKTNIYSIDFRKLKPLSYGILNPMVNWTRGWFTYDILTPGSIFLMVFWPRGQFFVIVFWTPSW